MSDFVEIMSSSARALLVAILVVAAFGKLFSRDEFEDTIRGLKVPHLHHQEHVIAAIVPILELMVALLLAVGWWLSIAATAGLLLFLVFIVLSMWAIRHRPTVSCRCFGALSQSQFSYSGIFRNVVLAGCSVFVLWASATDKFASRPSGWQTGLLVSAFTLLGLAAAQASLSMTRVKEIDA